MSLASLLFRGHSPLLMFSLLHCNPQFFLIWRMWNWRLIIIQLHNWPHLLVRYQEIARDTDVVGLSWVYSTVSSSISKSGFVNTSLNRSSSRIELSLTFWLLAYWVPGYINLLALLALFHGHTFSFFQFRSKIPVNLDLLSRCPDSTFSLFLNFKAHFLW